MQVSIFLLDECDRFTFIMISNMPDVTVLLFQGFHAWFSQEAGSRREERFVSWTLGREAAGGCSSAPGLAFPAGFSVLLP